MMVTGESPSPSFTTSPLPQNIYQRKQFFSFLEGKTQQEGNKKRAIRRVFCVLVAAK